MSEHHHRAVLVEGPVGRHLFKMALPMVFGIFAIIGFNLADTYFVAQIDDQSLAAMTFTFPVVMFFGSLALGLGIGASSLVSRAIGEGHDEKVKRLTTDSLLLAFLIVSLTVLVGVFTIEPLFRALGAKENLIPLIVDYMEIWYYGMPFMVIPMVGNSLIRATGDTRFPAMIMFLAAVVNVIMDPILIFGLGPIPAMGLKGAAYATVISRAVTFVASLYILYFREDMLSLRLPPIKNLIQNFANILKIGVPAATNNTIIPISSGVITWLLASEGEEVVAGFGVASRLEGFAVIPLLALSSVVGPFIGQNWGAQKVDRVKECLKLVYKFSIGWVLAMGLGSFIFADQISGVFSENPNIIGVSSSYLKIVFWSLFSYGFLINTAAAFNSLGLALQATTLTIFRMILIYIPLAIVLQMSMGFTGVFWAASVANILAGILAIFWFFSTLKKKVEV